MSDDGNSHKVRWIFSCLVLALVAALVPAAPAAAHGSGDQSTGEPAEECSAADYPGQAPVNLTEVRQSFVPSRGGLASVELCIENLVGVPGTDFTVHIYEGDNPAAPGARLASMAHDTGSNLLAPQWVHVDFADDAGLGEVPLVPGASYVVGVEPTNALLGTVSFRWRTTCTQSLLSSTCSTDRYPQGRGSDLPLNGDYAFRTFPFHDADLIGAVTVSPAVCAGLDLADRATGTVTNVSDTSVAGFDTQWLWSADEHRDDGDIVIDGGRHRVPGLGAGASAAIPPPSVPDGLPYGPGHLLLQLDVDGEIVESDDTNNVTAGPTSVTACGQPDFAELDLTVDQAQATAGFNQVRFADLDPDAIATLPQSPADLADSPAFSPNGFSPNGFSPNGFSPNGFSHNGFSPNGFSPNGFSPNGFSPNGFSPNGFSPNGFSPKGFSPAGAVLLTTVLDDLPAGLTDAMHVVNIPVVGDGWATRLSGLTDQPIQNVTLAEAVALLPELRIDEVDLSRVLTTSWLALALANGALDDTPVTGGWCAFIAEHGSSCEGLGVDPSSTSLLGLEATGFPAHQAPIAELPLAAVSLPSDLLVMDLPLTGQRRFNLELTRLGGLPVSDALVPTQTLVACPTSGCSLTLGQAAREGLLSGPDFRTLLAQLSADALQLATIGDLALGTASLDTLRLSAANWNIADVPLMDPECPSVTYRFGGTNAGDGAAVDPRAAVTLPPGFGYVPGSVALSIDGESAAAQLEPGATVSADGTRTLTFALIGEVVQSFELSFEACAGVYLGPVVAGSASVTGTGIDGPYSASTTSTDVVDVVERTPGVTTTPVAHDDNVVIADHISAPNAHDSWTFPLKETPGTMYVVKLFTPVGVDLDLIAFGPEHSATAFTPNGFSPNGFSPNGFSPNGFSPNGFSPNGFSPNGFSPNGFSPNGFSATASPDLLDDLPVDELRPDGSSGYAVSANRWDSPESMYLVSRPGDGGHFTFSVADYNGTRSDAPYFLTIQTVSPEVDPRLDNCGPVPWDLTKPAGAAPQWTGTGDPRTLFLANRQVTMSAHPTDAAAGLAALDELAVRPEVRGIVVNVDHDIDVRAAYSAWAGDWCNPSAANVVAAEIRGLVLELREQYPTIDTVVLAGDDALIPDFRLDDRSSLANEDNYVDALLNATDTNNPLVAAYAAGMIPSADPYGNEAPLPFGMSYAFPPSAGVSRLVEAPASWVAQKDLYVLSDGNLDPGAGFVSAYDGMVDGAEAAATALEGIGLSTDLLTDQDRSWTADDFRTAAFDSGARATGWNGHANHWGLLSDHGSETNDETELVTTAEADSFPAGALVFSNGCHFGTAVSDLLNAAPTEAERIRLRDWAEAITSRNGIAVANTGFGIFDTVEVGQGERLQQYFLEELDRADNVSLALARAKNRFFASPGVYDAYSYKTLQQLTVYGLGIFRMFDTSGDEPPEPAPPAAEHIAVTGGPYAVEPSGSSSCTDCYLLHQTAAGTRVELRDSTAETGHTSTNAYWSAPMSTRQVRLPDGMAPAGLWFNSIDSVTLRDRDPVITRLGVDDPAHEIEVQAAAPFPSALGTVNEVAGTAHVSLLHGIFEPQRMADGRVVGDMHLYTDIDADLLLRPDTVIGCTPHLDQVTVSRNGTGTLVLVEVSASEHCGANERAGILARTSDGTWVTRELSRGSDGHWSGWFPIAAGTELEDLHAQVSNGRGVGHWRHKGDAPIVHEDAFDGLDVLLTGSKHSSGIYTGPVQVTLVGSPGVSYAVYDNGALVGLFGHDDTFTLAGDGLHAVSITGTDGSTAGFTVAVDSSPPTIHWSSPDAGATYSSGAVDTVEVTCADSGTGATCDITIDGAPVANGSLLPTGRIGTYTVTVTATDAVENVVTSSRTFEVISNFTFSEFYSPVSAKPALNRVGSGSNIPVKFDVYDLDGVEQTDTALIDVRRWVPIDCKTKATAGTAFAATGGDPEYSGFFHFNVSAPTSKGCYELVVELVDGNRKTAYFQVR